MHDQSVKAMTGNKESSLSTTRLHERMDGLCPDVTRHFSPS
jgi:hypothetical protein